MNSDKGMSVLQYCKAPKLMTRAMNINTRPR